MQIFTKKILGTLFFLITFIFLIPINSSDATNFVSDNSVFLPKAEIINTDYYAAGGTVILDGIVNGDAYVAGGNIIVNGTVYGDVLAAGGNVSINGKVTGNVRAAGGQIIISGEVDRNVTVAGGSISVQSPALISGSFTAASGNLSLLAPIGKGAVIAGSQASINSAIGGNVRAAVGKLDVMQDAKIEGELNYWSPNPAHIAQFTVKDRTIYHHTDLKTRTYQKPSNEKIAGVMAGFSIIWITVSLAASFLVGLILLKFVPVYTHDVLTTITTRTWPSLGVGFISVILLPFAFVVLLMSVVGIPFAFLLVITFILLALINEIFIAMAIGKRILPQRNALALLVGLVIYCFISVIPAIGWMFHAFALFIGIGAIVIVEKNLYTSLRSKKLI